jgi:DNA-binding protein YbaB
VQDMILAAVNDAHRKVDEDLAAKMGGLVPGIKF